MKELRCTLLSDGSSDQALIPILIWLLGEHLRNCAFQTQWADLRRLRNPPRKLIDRIRWSLELYPCDLLFVHRDAEHLSPQVRLGEIHEAVGEIRKAITNVPPTVRVVPVRMQEAWLLFDLEAIRRASGNPQGTKPLKLPDLGGLEDSPSPKVQLYELLRDASGLQGHRRKKFQPNRAARRVADFIENFAPLRVLPAFHRLEAEIKQIIKSSGWS